MNLTKQLRAAELYNSGVPVVDIARAIPVPLDYVWAFINGGQLAALQSELGLDPDAKHGRVTAAALRRAIGAPANDESPPTRPDGSGEFRVSLGDSRWRFGKASEACLRTVHPDMEKVCRRALELSPVDFGITEGIRSLDTQIAYVKRGASKTYNSRHLHGLAVDVAAYLDGKLTWKSDYYVEIHRAFDAAARELGIQIRWGGDWDRDEVWLEKGEFDLVHHELWKGAYPDTPAVIAELRSKGLA